MTVDLPEHEPVICTSCNEQVRLMYTPELDEPYQLRCGCLLSSHAIGRPVGDSSLFEPFGKWSNVDADSEMRNLS